MTPNIKHTCALGFLQGLLASIRRIRNMVSGRRTQEAVHGDLQMSKLFEFDKMGQPPFWARMMVWVGDDYREPERPYVMTPTDGYRWETDAELRERIMAALGIESDQAPPEVIEDE